jgi:hypothetical protein
MPEIGTYSLSGGRRLARLRASSDPTDGLNRQSTACTASEDRTKLYLKTMKPFPSNAAHNALTADSSGQGLDVETNPPTPVMGGGLSLDIPLHRTIYLRSIVV